MIANFISNRFVIKSCSKIISYFTDMYILDENFMTDFTNKDEWTKSGGSEPVTCPQCSKTYKHRRSLWAHTKFECGKSPQFNCQICLHQFHFRSNLLSHLRKKHNVIN